MKKRNVISFIVAGFLFIAFAVFTVLIANVDVKAIGPNGSSVGFATLNKAVSQTLGVNMFLYNVTDWLSIIALLVALSFAFLGLVQLIKRKSLKKVDLSIILLGIFYSLVISVYVFFEVNIVNYRPVLINNYLEASYPSSTTMIVMCVMPTAIMQLNRLVKSATKKVVVNTIIVAFMVFIVTGRLLSGVHWFTDILGAMLFSSALVMLYYSFQLNDFRCSSK